MAHWHIDALFPLIQELKQVFSQFEFYAVASRD
jgi:hypothetical protein